MTIPLLPRCVLAFTALVACVLPAACSRSNGAATVRVERGAVVRKAVATGQVEPVHESQVNTHLAGFVRKLHAALGQKVAAGAPLCEVWPSLTERDLLAAERSLQSAIEGEETAQEYKRGDHVLAQLTRFLQGERNLDRMEQAAERNRRSAEESLRLLRDGKVEIDGRTIDFVVRAPVAGHVLQLVREGDPVTPASSYGVGTVVAVLGDLDQPVFRGAVDEIDVGRLRVGMEARVTLGALPGTELRGTVQELGLRARRVDNAATFDVRIALQPAAGVLLRAGYSAVAEVEVARADGVAVLPERVVQFDGGPHVWRAVPGGEPQRTAVELGVSDGLSVEIRQGLQPGDVVLERAPGR
jgi:HlyD family secretion protein